MLAVRLDNLGDVLMTGPALRAVKAELPECEITLLASPGGARAAELLPWVDRVIEHRALWQDLGGLPFDPQRELELAHRLAAESFDAALIFTSFSQTPHAPAYACYLGGIPIRIGASKEFGGGVLSRELRVGPREDAIHQVDRNLALLEAEGFEIADRGLEVHVPHSADRALDERLHEAGFRADAPWIVVSPWASCPARTYSPAAMVEAAIQLSRERGWTVALTGQPRHEEEAAPLLERLGSHSVDLVGRLSFTSFAALIKRAELVLTNNSAPMHLCDATGTPAVVLYAGTELESQWRPRRAPAILLRRPTSCQPCYAFNCPFDDHPCLAIPVDDVVNAGRELLGGRVDRAAAV